jgi:hypothetical protein
VADSGLFEANGVKLTHEVGEAVTLEPGDWHTFVNLVPAFSFGALEARYGRGTAVRMFHTLNRLGLAETVAVPEEEADWLNRLAEGVAPGVTWNGHAEVGETSTEEPEPAPAEASIEPEPAIEPEAADVEPVPVAATEKARSQTELKGVSAPASTTLTDGVYDEIRRLRSRVGDK